MRCESVSGALRSIRSAMRWLSSRSLPASSVSELSAGCVWCAGPRLSMPVATTETRTIPSRLSSKLAPTMMLASWSASSRMRVAQARLRGRPLDGRSVHVPPLAATVSRLADVSQQSRRRHRGDRPLCPADDRNQILYCLIIVRHGRRLWVSFGVTANPTAEWISRQVTEAFPWDHAPRYLIRERDTSYGPVFPPLHRAIERLDAVVSRPVLCGPHHQYCRI
jgi:hypothetical protein